MGSRSHRLGVRRQLASRLDRKRAAIDFDERFGAFVHVAAAAGTRRGEVCALRGTDIEWKEFVIPMDESTFAPKGGAKVLLVTEIPLPGLLVAPTRLLGNRSTYRFCFHPRPEILMTLFASVGGL
jgi:hypothetical protein